MVNDVTQAQMAAVVVLTQRHGFRKAVWLLQFLAAWAIAVEAHDWRPIDAEEYAEYWRISRAKGYRDLQKWRALYPNEHTPTARVLAARADIERLGASDRTEAARDQVAALLAASPAA